MHRIVWLGVMGLSCASFVWGFDEFIARLLPDLSLWCRSLGLVIIWLWAVAISMKLLAEWRSA